MTTNTIQTVEIITQGLQGPAGISDGDRGDVTVSSNGTSIVIDSDAVTYDKIQDLVTANRVLGASAAGTIGEVQITNDYISSSASIALSKLATGALPTAITVTSANISDLSIVNDDVNGSAAIAGTKISPDFGDQNIVTTGTVNGKVVIAKTDLSVTSNSAGTSALSYNNSTGVFTFTPPDLSSYLTSVAGSALTGTSLASGIVSSSLTSVGSLSSLDVTGNITVSGTVDGIDIATDVAANTAKVTNATHTGEVTGSTALTIADDVVDEANLKISNAGSDGQYLQKQSGNTGGLTWATVSGGGGSAGGANTIHMNDDVKLTFGDTSTPNLEIYHSADSHSFIKDASTGSLKICSDSLSFRDAADSQDVALFVEGGSCKLYDSGSSEPHFETTSNGAKVTGSLGVGTDPDTELHVKGIQTVAKFEGTGGASYIDILDSDDSSRAYIGVDGGTFKIQTGSGFLDRFTINSLGNATLGGDLTLEAVSGTNHVLKIPGHDGTNATTGCEINHQSGNFQITNSTGNSYFSTSGSLNLRTNGTTNALIFDTSQNATFGGNVGIGASADSTKLFSVNETVAGNNIAQFVNPSSTGQGIYVAAGTSDSTKYAFWIQNHDGSADAFKVLGDGTTTIEGNVTIKSSILEIESLTCLIDLMESPEGTTNHRIRNGNGNFHIQLISDDKNTTTNRLVIDGGTGDATFSENVGVGVTPSAWTTNADFKALQIGTGFAAFGRGSGDEDRGGIAVNYWSDGTDSKYIANGHAARVYLNDGNIELQCADSGTAGNNITFENSIRAKSGDAVELYFDGSGPKLETTGNGAKVSGSLLEIINTSNLGDAFLTVTSGTNAGSVIELQANGATANDDLWRIQNSGDNKLSFRSKESGSWVEKLGIEDDGDATFGGTVTATSVASSANGMRKITTSTSAPSGGSDGDVWFKYTA